MRPITSLTFPSYGLHTGHFKSILKPLRTYVPLLSILKRIKSLKPVLKPIEVALCMLLVYLVSLFRPYYGFECSKI